ncbi:MAG: right-handed parallel beta-helix repeat-containing protein [Candidatus Eisenbacteria bacterium]
MYQSVVDTLWVDVGTHPMHLVVERDRNLVVLGRGPASACVLEAIGTFPILDSGTTPPGNLSIAHVTLKGARGHGGHPVGGGAVSWGGIEPGGGVEVSDCRFEDNSSEGESSAPYGAAIAVVTDADVVIRDTELVDNASDVGAAILCEAGHVVVERCTFENRIDRAGGGSNIRVTRAESVSLVDCTMQCARQGAVEDMGVWARCSDFRAVRVDAYDLDAPACTKWDILWPEGSRADGSVEISECTFWSKAGLREADGDVAVETNARQVRVVGNTFAGIGLVVGTISGVAGTTVASNVVYQGRTDVILHPFGDIECNVFWPEPERLAVRNGHVEGNLTTDPRFCEVEEGGLTLRLDSPCLQMSAGCARAGALGVGCDGIAVVPQTWGLLKQRYRPVR